MKKYILLLLVSCVLISGCDKFLDVKSDARLVVPQTLEDAQALLDDAVRMFQRAVPGRGEDVSDDYYFTDEVYNGLSEDMRRFYLWDYPDYFGIANDWASAYAPIFNANLSLELLDQIERNSMNGRDWDNV